VLITQGFVIIQTFVSLQTIRQVLK